VIARRPDGYHELETLFLALPWGDHVEVERRSEPGIRLRVDGDADGVPADASNLAFRAGAAWLEAAGSAFDGGLDIRLAKRIPPGAGLGGGSSDAGTVLRLLDEAFGAVDRDALRRVAEALGADVPFFLGGETLAIGRGRGDEIESLGGSPPEQVVVILSGRVHETARVFAEVTSTGSSRNLARMHAALRTGDPQRLRAAHHNALREPAIRAYPEFGGWIAEVEGRLGRSPCMTGTGSTLYDLPEPGEARDVLRRLEGLDARLVLVQEPLP